MDKYELKKEKTKNRIIDAFASIMREKHFLKISVGEVCDKANISHSTFYLHYSSIDHLLSEMEADILKNIYKLSSLRYFSFSSETDSQMREDLVKRNCNYLEFYLNHKTTIIPLLSANGDPAFKSKLTTLIMKDYMTSLDSSGVSFGKFTNILLNGISMGAVDGIYKWLLNTNKTAKEASEEITDYWIYISALAK